MGFFSWLGEKIDSGISKIGEAFCAAVETVGQFAKTAISELAKASISVAKTVLKASIIVASSLILGPVVGPIVAVAIINNIDKVVVKLAKVLEITKEEEKTEEVGYRVMEAENHSEWKHREDFKSFEKFHEYLKEQIPNIDSEKLKENKDAYQMVGIGTLFHEISKKENIKLPDSFLMDLGRAKMTAEETRAVIGTFKEMGLEGDQISDYFEGRMSFKEEAPIRQALRKQFKKIYPKLQDTDINDRLDDISMAAKGGNGNMDEASAHKVQELYKEEIEAKKNQIGKPRG